MEEEAVKQIINERPFKERLQAALSGASTITDEEYRMIIQTLEHQGLF